MSKLRFSFFKKEDKRPIKKECKVKVLIQDLVRAGFPLYFASDLYELSKEEEKIEHILKNWKKEKDQKKRTNIIRVLQNIIQGKDK